MPISANSAAALPPALGLPGFPTPYWAGRDAALYLGDVRERLRALPTRSVHSCVTSPPYWGLRDYGTGAAQLGLEEQPDCLGWATGRACGHCYVCHMVEVFAEVRRVLRDDGTVWLNLGDSYTSGGRADYGPQTGKQQTYTGSLGMPRPDAKLRDGNLIGVPWRVALALQANGWVLRQDIIWYAPNKMPESVTNRCSKAHEHIFLLSKGPGYYYDAVAIAEEGKSNTGDRTKKVGTGQDTDEGTKGRAGSDGIVNKRDVWTVPTHGYPGAHFATYSPRLITPCILAGTSEYGCCGMCSRPYERVVVRVSGEPTPPSEDPGNRDRSFPSQRNGKPGSGSTLDGTVAQRETVGWHKPCGCRTDAVRPCVVLDPFVGSGTTVATALELDRAGVGIDMSEEYLRECAIPRVEATLSGAGPARRQSAVVASADVPPPPRRLR